MNTTTDSRKGCLQILVLAAVLVVLVVIYGVVSHRSAQRVSVAPSINAKPHQMGSAQESVRAGLLAGIVQETQGQLPMQLDHYTYLTDVSVDRDSLVYVLQIGGFDSSNWEVDWGEAAARQLEVGFCEDEVAEVFRSAGARAVYVAYLEDETLGYRAEIGPSDCAEILTRRSPRTDAEPIPMEDLPANLRPLPGSVSAAFDMGDPHNARCKQIYEEAISGTPSDMPLGEFTRIRDEADARLQTCVR